jgi:hypothetical protein
VGYADGAASGPDEGAELDDQEHEDGDDEASASDEGRDHDADAAGRETQAPGPPAPPAASEEPRVGAGAPGDSAHNFSLFSWLRRDRPQGPEPTPPEPGGTPKPGGD